MPKPITGKELYRFIVKVRDSNESNPKLNVKVLEKAIRWEYGTSEQTINRHKKSLVALGFIRLNDPDVEILVNGFTDKFAKRFFEQSNQKKYEGPKEMELNPEEEAIMGVTKVKEGTK